MDAPSLLPPAPRHTLPGGRGHRGRTPGDRKMVNVGRYHSKVFTNLKYHILLHLQAVSLKSNSYQRTTVDHIRPRPRRPEQDMMRYRKRPLADAVRGDAFGDAPRALSAADDVVTQLPAQAAAGRPAGGPAAHAPRRGLRSPLTPRKWDRLQL